MVLLCDIVQGGSLVTITMHMTSLWHAASFITETHDYSVKLGYACVHALYI